MGEQAGGDMDRIKKLVGSFFNLTMGIVCGTLALVGIVLFFSGLGLVALAISIETFMEEL